jgi:hypothetical protein
MFPVRYELNVYVLFRRNSAFKGLKWEKLHPPVTSSPWEACTGIHWKGWTVGCTTLRPEEKSPGVTVLHVRNTSHFPFICCFYCYYYYYFLLPVEGLANQWYPYRLQVWYQLRLNLTLEITDLVYNVSGWSHLRIVALETTTHKPRVYGLCNNMR